MHEFTTYELVFGYYLYNQSQHIATRRKNCTNVFIDAFFGNKKKIFCSRESCDRKNREQGQLYCYQQRTGKVEHQVKTLFYAHQTPWGLLMDGALFLLDDVHVSHLYIDCCQIPLSDLSPAIASALPQVIQLCQALLLSVKITTGSSLQNFHSCLIEDWSSYS